MQFSVLFSKLQVSDHTGFLTDVNDAVLAILSDLVWVISRTSNQINKYSNRKINNTKICFIFKSAILSAESLNNTDLS